jgi:hypothetical protein
MMVTCAAAGEQEYIMSPWSSAVQGPETAFDSSLSSRLAEVVLRGVELHSHCTSELLQVQLLPAEL